MGLAAWNLYLRIQFKTHRSRLNLLVSSYEPFSQRWKLASGMYSARDCGTSCANCDNRTPRRRFHQLFGSCMKSFKLLRAQLAWWRKTWLLQWQPYIFSENNFILQKRVSSECLIMLSLSSQKCDIVYGSQFIFFRACVMATLKPHAQPQRIYRTLNKNHILYSDLC